MKFDGLSVGLVFVFMLVICIGGNLGAKSGSGEKIDKARGLVVGVFDPRGVAVAYAHSDYHSKLLKEKMKEYEKCKKDGDTEKVKQLEDWGKEQQDRLHEQVFGTGSVKNLLEYVEKDMPEAAKEAGVDIIVSKRDIVYEDKDAEFVDVTELVIRGFAPDEKTLKIIRELKKRRPAGKS